MRIILAHNNKNCTVLINKKMCFGKPREPAYTLNHTENKKVAGESTRDCPSYSLASWISSVTASRLTRGSLRSTQRKRPPSSPLSSPHSELAPFHPATPASPA